jgi:Membrane bound beta barrel domain (DUF5777)
MKNKLLIILSLFSLLTNAQTTGSLLDGLEDTPKKQLITNTFKSSRVINGHSVEMIGAGVLDFRILHRFGIVTNGIENFFGLDQASMRMGFDYGISKNITIGIGRTTFKKEMDAFVKWRIGQQQTGSKNIPISIVWVSGASVFTNNISGVAKQPSFNDRLGYYNQIIIGRKFNEKISIQLSPTVVHRNEVPAIEDNSTFASGIGARYKVRKRVALVVDYFNVFNKAAGTVNPFSIGVDIETGGHVFQLHFSNANGMNERSFITETTNKWQKGQYMFGFNLSRVFTVKRKTKI